MYSDVMLVNLYPTKASQSHDELRENKGVIYCNKNIIMKLQNNQVYKQLFFRGN